MQQENLSCFGSIYVQQLLQVYEAFLQNPKCENTDDDIYMSASDKTYTTIVLSGYVFKLCHLQWN